MYSRILPNAGVSFAGVFITLCNIVFTAADPGGCYYCNTDVHGDVCNNPLNTSLVAIQMCSDMSLVESGAILPEATNGTNYVCSTLTYNQNNALVTIRSCENRIVSNRELCSHLTQTVTSTGLVTNFACKTCSMNLCNAATSSHLSLPALLVGMLIYALYKKQQM